MRRLKVPGRIIGRRCHFNHNFANPDTGMPLGTAKPAKYTKLFGWLREVTQKEFLINFLGLKKPTTDDVDIDGRDRAGMIPQPPEVPMQEIQKALLIKLLGNCCVCCSGKCTSLHKCRYSHLPAEYWLSYGGAGVTGKNRVN